MKRRQPRTDRYPQSHTAGSHPLEVRTSLTRAELSRGDEAKHVIEACVHGSRGYRLVVESICACGKLTYRGLNERPWSLACDVGPSGSIAHYQYLVLPETIPANELPAQGCVEVRITGKLSDPRERAASRIPEVRLHLLDLLA